MEEKDLIESGIDAANTLIQYLARDAVGADFMNQYTTTRDVQKKAVELQKEILTNLIASSSRMEGNTKELQSMTEDNASGLSNISDSINNLTSSISETEASYKKYNEKFQNIIEHHRLYSYLCL